MNKKSEITVIYRVCNIIVVIVFFALSFQILADESDPIKLEEIVITYEADGDKLLPEQPSSATVFDQKTLEERAFTSVQDVADTVPNLNRLDSAQGSFIDIIGIRGLVNTPFFGEPATIVYVDDVPYGRTSTYSNQVFGIDSVDVLRGPQGTLFGKNSYAGVINVTSLQATEEVSGRVAIAGGNYDYWAADGYASGALIPHQLYFSLGGAYLQRDGFLNNTLLNTPPDDLEHVSGRASLTWKPFSRWDIRLTGSADDFRDGAPRLVSVNDVSNQISSDLKGKTEQTINSQSLRIAYQGDSYEMLSVTARRNSKLDPLLVDIDFTPDPDVIVLFHQEQKLWTHEFRIRSTEKTKPWYWSAGFFYSNGQINSFRELTLFTVEDRIDFPLEEDNYALFGQLSYNGFTPLRLHAGLRIDYVEKSFKRKRQDPMISVVPIEEYNDYFFVSPNIAADYALTDQASLYARTLLATKPGGFSAGTDDPVLAEFDSERTWASELGFKWIGYRARADLALFYYHITDYQVERFFTPVDFFVFNAPETISYGVELELEATLLEGFTLESSLGYTNIEFEKYRDPITGADFKGKQALYTPEFNLMLATEYRHSFGYFARAEWIWTGTTYFDDQNTKLFLQDNYAVLNAHIGLELNGFAVTLYGRNLTDTEYFSFILPGSFAGTPGEPRTYGLKLSLQF